MQKNKNNWLKKIIVLLMITYASSFIEIKAQVVNKKPKEPSEKIYKKDVEKPTTNANWTWVDAEWKWKKKSNKYKWVKAHWEKAPDGKYWQKGHWKKVKKGWKWSPGYWK